MSDFVAGIAARHDAAARALRQAFAPPSDFAPSDMRTHAATRGPVGFAPQAGPKHFSPADPTTNPTAGWDPLDASAEHAGFLDPLVAAHAAGFAEGQAAAIAAGLDDASRDKAFGAGLAEALASGGRLDRDRIARQLRQTVLYLVSKLVGEIGISPELLAARISAAGELLADAAESALLRVHPDDVALLAGHLPASIFAAGDPTLPRGTFILESASTIVEDGPELWLEQLGAAIERVPVPPLTPGPKA